MIRGIQSLDLNYALKAAKRPPELADDWRVWALFAFCVLAAVATYSLVDRCLRGQHQLSKLKLINTSLKQDIARFQTENKKLEMRIKRCEAGTADWRERIAELKKA